MLADAAPICASYTVLLCLVELILRRMIFTEPFEFYVTVGKFKLSTILRALLCDSICFNCYMGKKKHYIVVLYKQTMNKKHFVF